VTLRRLICWLHLITAAVVGIVILVMAATGVMLAFEPQIVDYFERDVRRVTPPGPGVPRLTMDAILAAASVARPGTTPSIVTAWSKREAAVRVGFGRDDGVYVDPYTGRVLGRGSKVQDTLHAIEDWHRWLGSRERGRPITGACNLAFLGLAVSGLYLWWPRSWSRHALRAIVWFGPGLRGRARDWNWHNTIGFWCAPALIVILLSGAVMSYQWANDLLYRLTGNDPPAPAGRGPGTEMGPGGGRPSGAPAGKRARSAGSEAGVEALWARAEQQVPDWVSISLRLPARPGTVVTAFVQERAPAGPGPYPRSPLTLDPVTADVLRWEPYASANTGRKLRAWARYLHTGEAAGIVGQAIAGVASAGAVMLVWTGLSLAGRRFFAWNGRRAAARRGRWRERDVSAEAPGD
jgi:uncharacterized iron-regulated membrane protein